MERTSSEVTKTAATGGTVQMHIRKSLATDVDHLAAMRWALRTDDGALDPGMGKKEFFAAYRAWALKTANDAGLVHWVAEIDGHLVGVVSVRLIAKMPSPEALEDRFGYITNTYVCPEYRNAGVGSNLLAAVKDWAIGEELEILVVWPSELAYRFYERAGYVRELDPLVLKVR